MTRVEARTVSFTTHGTFILEAVDLVAEAGNVTAIVGPNGSGKTTLLRLLAGLARPTTGEVTFDGHTTTSLDIADLARLRAYMSPALPGAIGFPVREVVRMGRHPWGSTQRETWEAVERSIVELELDDLADRPHWTLSTGEARRTHVARILAQETEVLLLDEPEGGLDIGYSELVLDRLSRAAADAKTVVTILHDLNSAARIADRIAVLDSGRVVAEGRPEDVLNGDLLSDVYRHPIEVLPHPSRPGVLVLPGRPDRRGIGQQEWND